MAEVPAHVSHSAFAQYIKCGKQYELQRIAKVPTPPAWYLIGGSAVHKATEYLDNGIVAEPATAWSRAFDEEISEAFEGWPEEDEWIQAGRPRRDGSGQGYEYWDDRGYAAVVAWLDWRKANPHMQLLFAEWEFTLPIEGRIFRGFIDRVFLNTKTNRIDLIDLKTGTKRPDNAHQLGFYKVAWEHSPESQLHPPVGEGGFWMAKDGANFVQNLTPYTPGVLGRLAEQYVSGVENDIFLPNVTGHCFGCTVASACGIVNPGSNAAKVYDSLLKSGE